MPQNSVDTLTTLHALTLDSGSVTGIFDSTILSYTDSVASTVTSLHVTATASSASDTVKINGVVVTSGVAVLVNVPTDTTITIVVSNPNTPTKRTYMVRIAHKAAVVTTIPWNSAITYGTLSDARDGKSYRTVKIGTQTWMAENLNYRNTTGSTDSVGKCYNNSADSCVKYGRLYSWAEAMKGAASSTAIPSGVQGVCPAGWHVPSDGEWSALATTVGGLSILGQKLKASSGWTKPGIDEFGCRILPGGVGYTYGFNLVSTLASFWTGTDAGSTDAKYRVFTIDNAGYEASELGVNKTSFMSQRCVQDIPDTLTTLHRIVFDSGSLSPVFDSNVTTYTDTVSATVSSFNVSASPSSSNATLTINGSQVASGAAVTVLVPKDTTITFVVANGPRARTYTVRVVHKAIALTGSGTFPDSRDNQTYKYVTTGTQVWMAKNLNYKPSGPDSGWCYNNDTGNCATYGRLYDWATAMAISQSYNTTAWGGSDVKHQGICPVGWHVPSDAEWMKLTDTTLASATAGTKLKANSSLWSTNTGTDDYGFTVLPAGLRSGSSSDLGYFAYFRSASENSMGGFSQYHGFSYSLAYASRTNDGSKTIGYSLRCLQD